MNQLRSLKHQDYTVGWICALPLELIASRAMLDENHASLPQDEADHNTYVLGRIGTFNVAMACLPAGETGNNSAAIVGAQMKYSFKKVRIGLLVGIGGGVPSASHDIRLGDVVVSKPGPQNGGVVQYDFGKTIEDGHFIRTGSLDKPPRALRTALAALYSQHAVEPSRMPSYLDAMNSKLIPPLRSTYAYQGSENDQLYEAKYDHPGGSTCVNCDPEKLVMRVPRESSAAAIHYGTIASANQVMRNGATRDRLAEEFGGLCFEMEAAGLMDDFRCVVIRGVCDYADSHKNKRWQEYAAATAAAYAKELLGVLPPEELAQINTDDVLRWISTIPYEYDHKGVQVLHGTGEWLLTKEIYTDWKKSEAASTFLLHAIPGAGKTTLAHLVIEDLKLALLEGEAVAYFYCKSGSSEAQQVLRSLIRQLVSQAPKSQTPALILNEFDRSQKQGYGPEPGLPQGAFSLENCVKFLIELSKTFSSTTIIVDAVDECEDTDDLLDALDEFGEECQKTKLFFTSREEFAIVERYSHSANLSISREDNRSDIEKFVRSRLNESIRKKKLLRGKVEDEVREEITDILISKAEGMFLLPKLQLQAIEGNSKHESRMIRPADVREKLSQLPNDLTNIYEEFLDQRIMRYMSETQDLTLKALKWLLCARERLSISGLLEAVSFRPTDDMAVLTVDELLLMCQHLVSVDPQSNTVDFAHTTVREYLGKRFTQREADAMASETCLSYLCLKYRGQKDERSVAHQGDGFEGYSILYWPAHVGGSGTLGFNECVTKWLQKFIDKQDDDQDPPYARWMGELRAIIQHSRRSTLSPSRRHWYETLRESLSEDADPLFGAYAFGFTDLAKKLTDSIGNVLPVLLTNENGSSLMSIACGQGHIELAKILLETSPEYFASPYQVRENFTSAVLGGHLGMVKFLFEKNPSILKENGLRSDMNMLSAAMNGYDEVLGFMVDNGAVSSNEAFYRTPLHVVASRGSKQSVKKLLDRGAKMEAKLPDGMNALHMAASNGHAAVVALLIARGAEVMAKTTDGKTALHMAASNGHVAIVALLIAGGIDVMTETTNGKTAFSMAVSNGRFKVVEVILRNIPEKGDLPLSDIEELCENIIEPPMLDTTIFISPKPYIEPVQRRGVRASIQAAGENTGESPLDVTNFVSPRPHIESVMRRRLHAVNEAAGENVVERPMVETSLSISPEPIIEPVRRRGVRASNQVAVGRDGRTPLMFAALNAWEEISGLILQRYPETVNAMDNNGCTALHYAAGQGTAKVVQLLLDHGADTTIVVASVITALVGAAIRGSAEAVRILLEHDGEEAWRHPKQTHVAYAWLMADVNQNRNVKSVISEVGLRFKRRFVWQEAENSLTLEIVP